MGIRRATPADARTLAEVAAATFVLACPPGTTEDNIALFIATSLSVERFEDYLQSPQHRLWLAYEGESATGYAMSVHGEPSDPDIQRALVHRPSVELSKIYVRDTHHGSGVAAGLVAQTIDEARQSDAASVWLGVNQNNVRANRFYEKQGFELRGTRQFQVGDSLEEDYVREKPLGPGIA